MSNINIAIIILAGGIGKRFNKKISKQMISYSGVTVLEMNIKNAFKHNLMTYNIL